MSSALIIASNLYQDLYEQVITNINNNYKLSIISVNTNLIVEFTTL